MRWIAVLPVAALASLAVGVVAWLGEILLRVSSSINPYGGGSPDWYVYIASGALSSGAFVWAGTAVAPRSKFVTAIVLSVIVTGFGMLTAVGLSVTGSERSNWYAWSTVIGAFFCMAVCVKAKQGAFE